MARLTRKSQTDGMSELEQRLMDRFWITVSQEAINKSVRRDKRWCMVSRGIAYSITGSTRIDVDTSRIKFTRNGYRYVYDMIGRIAKKVAGFDDGKNVRPFRFQTNLPVGVVPVHNRPPGSVAPIRRRPTLTTLKAIDAAMTRTKSATRRRELAVRRERVAIGYAVATKKHKCGTRSSRRWHGLTLPKTVKRKKAA